MISDYDAYVYACPFCGGRAELVYNYSEKSNRYYVFIRCTFCRSQGRIYGTKEPMPEKGMNKASKNAVMAWNLRTGKNK